MHRRRDNIREFVTGGDEGRGEVMAEARENGKEGEEMEVTGEERVGEERQEGTDGREGGERREGVEEIDNTTVQPKKESTCSLSSSTDHFNDSASEPDETQGMADTSQQENNIPITVDSPGGSGGGSTLQELGQTMNQPVPHERS